jgi:Rhs element Vgr protein
MTAPSPTADLGLVACEVRANGGVIKDTYQVKSIDTWNAVNRVPRARIVLYDGSPSDRTFEASSDETFIPGATIDVSAGYDSAVKPIFSGIIVRHSIEIVPDGTATLIVDIADKAIKMTVARNTAISAENKKDSDIITALITDHGLSSDVESTTTQHEAVVQFDATDWDTLLTRAEMNGMLVITDAAKVSVKAPDTSSEAVLQITYGDSILDLSAEMDAVGQLASSAVTAVAWDSDSQAVITRTASGASLTEAGNVPSATLAGVLGVGTFTRLTGGFVTSDDLASWSSAEQMRSVLSKICGRVTVPGSSLVKTGTTVALGGLGDRFNGTVFVSGVHHTLREGNWTTTIDFGLPAGWHAYQRPSAFAPASGHLPPIRGLQTGVVKKIAEDPAGAYRVQISLPLVQDDSMLLWARLGGLYASNAVGTAFYPEVGDEVVVGFMNEDPRFPVVLGSVYSKKFAPPYPPDQENKIKGLKTKSKIELTFDDTDKIVTIKTPGGHQFVMNDKQGSITITDSNNNSVELGKNGISVDGASNIDIKAKGNITINASGNLSLKANGNATCEGVQIDLKAQASLSAQGQASAELKASGVVTIEGGLVKIN